MSLELKNYDPSIMQGANIGVSVDLTDLTDANGNEVIEIDGVTSAVNFVRVTNAITAEGPTISARGDDTNIALTINSLLTGALTLDSTSTGAIDIGISAFAKTITIGNETGATAVTIDSGTGAINIGDAIAKTITIGNTTGATAIALKSGSGGTIVTSADADGFTVGANGATNPVIKVDTSTASVATGISITGAATGTAVALAAIGSAADESITINAKAAGTIGIGGTSTGLVSIALASSAAGVRWKRSVLASSGNTTMTSAMSGSIMLVDGATVAYTLPAIGTGDVGMEFWFTVTVASTAATITAGAADLLTGGVMCMSSGAGIESDQFQPDVTDDLIITMNGTTQGGNIGSTWHLIAISATRWYCDGTTLGSGTLVTPFS